MNKLIMILIVVSVSVIAMDNKNKKEENVHNLLKQMRTLDGIKFIQMSSNQKIYSSYDQKMITDLCFIYREYFEDIKKRDLKFCTQKTFNVRLPSFYLKQFQVKQFFDIKKEFCSLKGLWFFFSSNEYAQMDTYFFDLYKKHKDLEKTWNDFISYFLDNHVVKPLVNKKYYAKESQPISIV